ncbi:MAG: plasmid pRiA4b ORF-3 family protein [Paludibacteraceae bacterium]|nr:plasmid pRiA4b ORF-3 family protein [Paludibacteraceae bacterium]
MIYKITFSCDEGEDLRLTFEADPEATFLDLHKAILAAVRYKDDQMTSFFMCNDRWEKEQEVTLVEMDNNFEYDNMTMENTRLSELMEEQGQRLIYIFDPMFERYFFGSLREIMSGQMEGVKLVEKKGKAPKQLQTEDSLAGIVGKDGKADWESEEDFYGDSQYDAEDLDMEGFQDLSFDDGSMF